MSRKTNSMQQGAEHHPGDIPEEAVQSQGNEGSPCRRMDNRVALQRWVPRLYSVQGARPKQRLMQQQVLYVTKGSKKETKLAKGCKAVEDEPEYLVRDISLCGHLKGNASPGEGTLRCARNQNYRLNDEL